MSTSIPYVYQYQRNEMFNIGTSVQRPDFVKTDNAAASQSIPQGSAFLNSAAGFPGSLVNGLTALNAQPLGNPLLGLSLTPQTSSLRPSQGVVDVLSLKAPSAVPLEAANPIQAKLAALQPAVLPPDQVVTGPFANADKALSQTLAANRGVEIVPQGAQAAAKVHLNSSYPARVEDRTLQMPPMPYNASTEANSGMFGMLGRLQDLFSSSQVRNPTDGQGGQAGYMHMGGSSSGEGHKGEHSQKRPQAQSRFSAMA